jgi:signal peptidase II
MAFWKHKWVIFGLVMVVGVAADQWTKLYAEARLASISRDWQHELVLTPDKDVERLRDYLRQELTWSTDAEVDQVASRYSFTATGRPLNPDSAVKGGQPIHIKRRTATVVEGYFDLVYARNPGAAWSFMAEQPEWLRKAFFRTASVFALVLIAFMLHKTAHAQALLVWGLSLVASGAVGNLIDRLAYGYVIDFVAWHIGDKYWPTFNIADAWIFIGVALMFIDFFVSMRRGEPEGEAAEPAGPSSAGEAKSQA